MKRGTMALALTLLSGCFADLLVSPEPNVAPSLSLFVSSLDDAQRSYAVGGFLRRGSGAEGEPRAMLDAALLVGDSAVQPDSTRDGYGLLYAWSASSTQGEDSIRIRTPVVADLPSSGVTLTLPVPTRSDAFLADHQLGEDLRLTVRPVGDTIPGLLPLLVAWQLDIRTPRVSGNLFRLEGRGSYPSPLRVPAEFLALEAGDSLVVSFFVFGAHRTVASAYPVEISLNTRLTWHRRVVSP